MKSRASAHLKDNVRGQRASRPFSPLPLTSAGQYGSVYRALWKNKVVAVKKTMCFEQEVRETLHSLSQATPADPPALDTHLSSTESGTGPHST